MSKNKSALLKLTEITVPKNLYPRTHSSWQTAHKYAMAMKTGAKFPPVLVAKLGNKYVLVDGWHRISAHKENKEEYVRAEILTNIKDEAGVLAESVKVNVQHGLPLNSWEVRKAIVQLEKFGMSQEEISKITQIPVAKITPFVSKRITNTLTGKQIVLKTGVQHLAGQEVDDNIEEEQSGISVPQTSLLDQLITLVENQWLDLKREDIKEKVQKLKGLLESVEV